MRRHPARRRTDWMNEAACAADPNPDWVTHPRHLGLTQADQLRRTCLDCAVIDACYTWASTEPGLEGWAAGLGWPRP